MWHSYDFWHKLNMLPFLRKNTVYFAFLYSCFIHHTHSLRRLYNPMRQTQTPNYLTQSSFIWLAPDRSEDPLIIPAQLSEISRWSSARNITQTISEKLKLQVTSTWRCSQFHHSAHSRPCSRSVRKNDSTLGWGLNEVAEIFIFEMT